MAGIRKVLPCVLVLLFLCALMGKPVRSAWRQHELSYWREVCLAAQQAAVDRGATGDASLGWPADVEARSARGYLGKLEKDHYIKKLLVDFGRVEIGNVAQADPEEVVFARGQGLLEGLIVRKSARAEWMESEQARQAGPWPVRQPAILPP